MRPTHIILHHSLTKDSQTVSWGAIRRYHTETLGWPGIGYHIGIELVGDYYEALLGQMLNHEGTHTKGHNHDSIGICFVGNFDQDEVPPEQWHKGLELTYWLCSIFSIPYHNVYGHRDFANKSCPGNNFNLGGFRLQLTAMNLGESIQGPQLPAHYSFL